MPSFAMFRSEQSDRKDRFSLTRIVPNCSKSFNQIRFQRQLAAVQTYHVKLCMKSMRGDYLIVLINQVFKQTNLIATGDHNVIDRFGGKGERVLFGARHSVSGEKVSIRLHAKWLQMRTIAFASRRSKIGRAGWRCGWTVAHPFDRVLTQQLTIDLTFEVNDELNESSGKSNGVVDRVEPLTRQQKGRVRVDRKWYLIAQVHVVQPQFSHLFWRNRLIID